MHSPSEAERVSNFKTVIVEYDADADLAVPFRVAALRIAKPLVIAKEVATRDVRVDPLSRPARGGLF